MTRRLPTGIVLFALALAAGCEPRLNENRDYDLKPGETQHIIVNSVSREQKIKVTVTAKDVPVNVYICLEKNKEKAAEEFLLQKKGGAVLAEERKTEQATLEAVIPPNSEAQVTVTLASGKTGKVNVKITN